MVRVQAAAGRAAGCLAGAIFVWWAAADGGYAPGVWYPGALALIGALFLTVRTGMYRTLRRPARWALVALAAFAAWSFCSIAWADARGDAWDGANRTLLYSSVFALFVLVPWTVTEAAVGLGMFALAIAGLGVVAVGSALAGAESSFLDGRLAAPTGYENASAALFLVAFWVAVLLAARGATPGAARPTLLAAAGVLAQLTVLTQSRGSLMAGGATLAAALALAPERRRVFLALAPVAVVTLASLPALLGVYSREATTGGDVVPAAVALALSAAVLAAAGVALDPLDRWAARRRAASRPRLVAAGFGLLAVAGVCVAVAGGPLTASGGAAALDSRFAAGAGTGRYDLWRVAGLEFARNPIGGVGADNFAHDYARDGRRHEEPLYPHSLALRAFSQTGLVGGALLAGFLALAGLAILGARAEPLVVASGVAAAAWVVQGSIDWLWEMPAVAAPAMAGLGFAAGLGERAASGPAPARRRTALAAGALLAVGAAASYAFPALAAREIKLAATGFAADRGGALRRLDRARALNPLSDRADLVAGALTRASGDREAARRYFARAVARDPRNWHPHVELALLDAQAGRRDDALARLALAARLRPGERLIGASLDSVRAGAPPSGAVLDELAAETLPGPLGRRAVECAPDLGLARSCTQGGWR